MSCRAAMSVPCLAAALLLMVTLAGCTRTWVEAKYQQPDRFATWVDSPTPPVYLIQPGDDLSVALPFNPELDYKAPVAPDGTFTMPLAGTIQAAGLSVAQLAENLDKALASRGVAADAQASVGILRSAGRVYVGGQVGLPGEVPLRGGMSVMQAIIAARGMLDTARTGEVVLIRRGPDGRPMLRTIDVDGLTQRGDPGQEVALQPADTIFVPQSSIAEVDQWINQHINLVLPFNRSFNYTITNDTSASQ